MKTVLAAFLLPSSVRCAGRCRGLGIIDLCDYCIFGLLRIRHANARGMFCNCLNDKRRHEEALM